MPKTAAKTTRKKKRPNMFNFSNKFFKALNEGVTLDKALQKCINRKCRKVATKKKLRDLGVKHLKLMNKNCDVNEMDIDKYIAKRKKCVETLDKEDKFGYIKMLKDRTECSELNCKEENDKIKKHYEKNKNV